MKLLGRKTSLEISFQKFSESTIELEEHVNSFMRDKRKLKFKGVDHFYVTGSSLKIVYLYDSFEHVHRVSIESFLDYLLEKS